MGKVCGTRYDPHHAFWTATEQEVVATRTQNRLLDNFLEHFQGHFDNCAQVTANEKAGLTPRHGGGYSAYDVPRGAVRLRGLSGSSDRRTHHCRAACRVHVDGWMDDAGGRLIGSLIRLLRSD